jgi:putative transposase
MSRIARVVIPGWPYHVVHRGNNKQMIFFNDEDNRKYLQLVRWYSEKWNVRVLAYSLMPTHVHLLLVPKEENSLAKTMQGISLCYTQQINKKYKRTGRLWECRYHSCVVDKNEYFWIVVWYIERNPVRAGLVKKPEEYEWSSARAHILGIENPLVNSSDLLKYGDFDISQIHDPIHINDTIKEINKIKTATQKGLPLGNIVFQRKVENILNRKIVPKRRGRPWKNKGLKNGMCPELKKEG